MWSLASSLVSSLVVALASLAFIAPAVVVPLDDLAAQESASTSRLAGAARWADTVRVLAEEGVISGDTARLHAALALADRALGAFPDDALLLHYRGYALHRLVQRSPEADADARLQRAAEALERSASLRPLPETWALLNSVYGMQIGGSMLKGIRLGPKASRAQERAEELAPSNPRVLLTGAISAWYRPAMMGGGEEKARRLLEQAIAAFATDAPAPPLPAWGHAEAYAWLGQIEAAAGNATAARAAYTRALELEPEYAWVRLVLLPALAQGR